MTFDLLITGGEVYAPQPLGVADVGIRDGKIAAIGRLGEQTAAERVPADGKLVFPGLVETHAHMLLPQAHGTSRHDFFSGTVAAAFGGVTTLLDFADQRRGRPAMEAVAARMAQAEGKCVIDFGFHCTLTDINRETLAEVETIMDFGIPSFKFYTIYREAGLYLDDGQLRDAFRCLGRLGGLATVHAENDSICERETAQLLRQGLTAPRYFPASKPAIVEAEAVQRVLLLAGEAGVAVVIRHLSSRDGVAALARALESGQDVAGETCPQYLLLDEEVYGGSNGAWFVCHPPLRREADREALWRGITTGEISLIGTDDCAFSREQKNRAANFAQVPGGLPGIETCLPLLYTRGVSQGRMTMTDLVRSCCTEPARRYGLYPRKGALQVGADADLVVFDPDRQWQLRWQDLHQQADWSPYQDWPLRGKTEMTVSRGRIIVRGDQFLGHAGAGRFLKRTGR